jgi:hypothetical protein
MAHGGSAMAAPRQIAHAAARPIAASDPDAPLYAEIRAGFIIIFLTHQAALF